jgi:hypothetical protein
VDVIKEDGCTPQSYHTRMDIGDELKFLGLGLSCASYKGQLLLNNLRRANKLSEAIKVNNRFIVEVAVNVQPV